MTNRGQGYVVPHVTGDGFADIFDPEIIVDNLTSLPGLFHDLFDGIDKDFLLFKVTNTIVILWRTIKNKSYNKTKRI